MRFYGSQRRVQHDFNTRKSTPSQSVVNCVGACTTGSPGSAGSSAAAAAHSLLGSRRVVCLDLVPSPERHRRSRRAVSGFIVQSLGFRVQDSRSKVWDLRFRVQALRFRV